MGLLMWIVFGALVGVIADYIDTSVSLSWGERIVVGIIGSIVGGIVASMVTTGNASLTPAAGFDLMSIIFAVGGALLSLFVWKRVVRRPRLI